jgi:hypothetical protein
LTGYQKNPFKFFKIFILTKKKKKKKKKKAKSTADKGDFKIVCFFSSLQMTIYKFGPHLIKDSQVFYKSKLTLGIVNLKPIAP